MNFKELLKTKNISGYALAKNTGIPYATINDLINGKTVFQNVSLKHAIAISDYLKINIRELSKLENKPQIEFRYFRNNLLADLKRNDPMEFARKLINSKEIDYYYKNNAKECAYYILALIDYIFEMNKEKLYGKRYNNLRKEKLDRPFFGGSKIINFKTIEEAEKTLNIKVIPEFKKFNIIEEDIFNVA